MPFIKLEVFTTELCFTVKTKHLDKALIFFKNHYNCQFKVLTCISGVDFPKNQYRFAIIYEILTLRFNTRIRIKCFVNEISPINSIQNIFIGAG
jgi:NADH:ubiquinone oxidoreductase subunit C